MKNWKKYTSLLLALVMCLSLAACSKKSEEPTSSTVEEPSQTTDISGFTGFWQSENEPTYYVINESCEWSSTNFYGEQVGSGNVVTKEGFITLCMKDGTEAISLWKTAEGNLRDADDNLLLPTDSIMLLPTPEDELNQTAYFSDDFSNVSINYPIQMNADKHPDFRNSLSFNAVMENGTDDHYSNIMITFQPISDYDSYMEKGSASAEPYMKKMIEDFMDSMYGDYLIKFFGSEFKDNGSYYSLTSYMWLDGAVFDDGPSQPVRGSMEVRYYGPTGYALVATTIALENRIQNYYDICNNMLTTLSYTTDWSTAPKSRPEQPASSDDTKDTDDTDDNDDNEDYSQWSDPGDYGTPYYWYDEDGDIWYWNGYENEFVCFGSDGYIDEDTGEFMESNDAGWDYDDEYYDDDYDPWSDPGDGGYDPWSDPGDYGYNQ